MKRLLFLSLSVFIFSCNPEPPITPGLLVPRTVDEDPALPSLLINGTLLHVETFGTPTDPMILMIHGKYLREETNMKSSTIKPLISRHLKTRRGIPLAINYLNQIK
ncbi:MAG: hypothetical protein SF052_14155 [Bacteroidia bacterium]|nr:hypothetical protein [Bacteroidia bacterium]